jgi:ribulose 1,5-bisphosphate carboxylase large subunit-like protein
MGWITAIIELAKLVPAFVALIQQIIAIVKSHPSGPKAGVVAVRNHLAALDLSSSPRPGELK